ncbi:VCBS repeat-containing protein [Nannocystis sp. ILAH1]|uniref:FG-GAP repeat domain-containing protein n=1 Tax=Nannocystis sp. ILAH1 TaxID=2996789 RepID=UPI00226E6CF0|nr:VCBS repeat-containing protein [Nannocystis sp. ILAH1]MCY0989300.1 VCBS repeat-containing protein [Nannocystis sp. ILAH1]
MTTMQPAMRHVGWVFLGLCACPPPDDGEPTTSTSSTSTSTSGDTSTSTSGDTSTSTSSDTSTSTTSTSSDTSTTSTSGDTSTSTSGDTSTSTGEDTTTGGEPACVQSFVAPDIETCYAPAVPYVQVPGTAVLLAGDVDQDGHVDVIAPGAVGGIAVLLGDGAGGLAAPVITPVDAPTSAALGDFDADGLPDLVVSFAGAAPRIDLLLGDGAGGFVVETSFASGPTVGNHLAAGDFDGDGDLDAVAIHQGVSNITPKRLSTITNVASSSWTYAVQPLTMFVGDVIYSSWTPYLGIGDFDGEHLDVIVATDRTVEQPHRLRADGLGGFTYLGKLVPNNWLLGAMPIVPLDVDGDGDNDIIAADKAGWAGLLYVENLGGGWAAPKSSSLPGPGKQQLAVGSLIHEPRPDLVYTGNQGETLVRTIEEDGDIVAPSVSQFGIGYARGFVLADLNEDGRSDYVQVSVGMPYTLSVRVSL